MELKGGILGFGGLFGGGVGGTLKGVQNRTLGRATFLAYSALVGVHCRRVLMS